MGLVSITHSQQLLEKNALPEAEELIKADVLKVVTLVSVMTIHSFPEDIAAGLSLGKELTLGFLISLVIALHNIPDGPAIELVLVPQGVKSWKVALWSVFWSLP